MLRGSMIGLAKSLGVNPNSELTSSVTLGKLLIIINNIPLAGPIILLSHGLLED